MTDSQFRPLRGGQSNTNGKDNSKERTIEYTTAITQDQLRNKHGLEVDGTNIPPMLLNFEEMKLPSRYLSFIRKAKNVNKPTPIQMQAISCLINNRDVIGISSTGSGKTYAYILPMLSFLLNHNGDGEREHDVSPTCLIVVPSRELMSQVLGVVQELLQGEKSKSEHSCCFMQETQNSSPTFLNDNSDKLHNSHLHNLHNSDNSHNLQHNNVSNLPGVHFSESNRQEVHSKCGNPNSSQHSNANYVVGVCGGIPIKENLSKMNSSTVVLVATPGRLIDLYNRKKLSLSAVRYFVIDECDKLLDMGLEEQLRNIVAMVTVHGNSLRTSLWSATLPQEMERLARSAVVDPVYICAGAKDTIISNIKQNVVFVHTYRKPRLLLDTLRQIPFPPVIVFVQSKDKADELADLLCGEQFQAAAMHSGLEQSYREQVMLSFKGDELDVIVATDLISRGIDIPCVGHVINYDTPASIDDYLHRCGRTGRFGRHGVAVTFLTLDCKIAKELKDMLEATNSEIPRELLDVKSFGKKVLRTEMGDRVIE